MHAQFQILVDDLFAFRETKIAAQTGAIMVSA